MIFNTAMYYYSIDTSDATATENDILAGKTAYVNNEKITGTISTKEPETPHISFDMRNGLVTARSYYRSGYYAGGTPEDTYELPHSAGGLFEPGTSDRVVIPAYRYLLDSVTIMGDSNLAPENIKQGVSIFGVDGTYEGASQTRKEIPVTINFVGAKSSTSAAIFYSGLSGNTSSAHITSEYTSLRDGNSNVTIDATAGPIILFVDSWSDTTFGGFEVTIGNGMTEYSPSTTYPGRWQYRRLLLRTDDISKSTLTISPYYSS